MALSIQRWEADGIQKTFGFNFGYLSRSHVFVFVNNTLAAFKWTGDFQVELLVIPLPGETVTIRRLTDRANRVTTYTDGQTLLAESLNAGDLQTFYIAQEMIDQIEEGIVAGDVSVINPGEGYITAQWIQAQLDANLAAASQFEAIDNALVAEATARAAALTAETLARGEAIFELEQADLVAGQRIDILEAEVGEAGTGILARIGTLETVAVDLANGKANVIVVDAIEARVDAAEADIVAVETAVATEAAARTSADSAIQAQISAPGTGLAARATSLESRVTSVEINKAEASTVNSLSAQINTPSTGLLARATSLEARTATVETNKAEVTALNSLTATLLGGQEMVPNAQFKTYAADTGLPGSWTEWINGAVNSARVVNNTEPDSTWCVRVTNADNTHNVGWRQYLTLSEDGGGRVLKLKAAVRANSGSIPWNGAGVMVECYSNGYAANLGFTRIFFQSEADVSGVISNSLVNVRRQWEKTFTVPAGTRHVIVYGFTNYPGVFAPASWKVLDWFELSLRDAAGYGAGVSELREALSTGSSSLARLLLAVNTSTNVATIEAAAFTGDGTWNGSAITLQADLIKLLARNINFGTNTVFEDTKGSLYTTSGGRRLRMLGPFGTSSDLVIWYGPTSVGLNSETKTNGHFAFATDGKVYYGNAELGGAGTGAIAKAGIGAESVTNSGTWWGLGSVSFPDVQNPSYIKFPYVDIIGDGPASGSGLSANWFWRIVGYPSGNPGAAVQIAAGDMTTAAGGAGEPVSITLLQQPAQRLNNPPHYGNVIYQLQVWRQGGGTGTVPLRGTIYVENIPG